VADLVREIKTVGVVGAGTMGRGIARVAAEAGFQVLLVDVTQELVDRALQANDRELQRMVEKGKLSAEDRAAVMARFKGTADLTEMAACDFVIEAIFEDLAVKKDLFRRLDEICRPGVVLASNTSALSITEIAVATRRPQLVAGMHFFNPAPVMKLVEVVRGLTTGDETADLVREMAVRFGKEPVIVKESPGFVVNRILVPMMNEAIWLLQEGVASAEDIDKAMKLGANHPIGPLALADLVGLDVLLAVVETLHRELGEDKYRPAPLLRQMVRAGRLGRKSGAGFYQYA
jgi:3-hydroxybutyryl-CoA dehydrogenase